MRFIPAREFDDRSETLQIAVVLVEDESMDLELNMMLSNIIILLEEIERTFSTAQTASIRFVSSKQNRRLPTSLSALNVFFARVFLTA